MIVVPGRNVRVRKTHLCARNILQGAVFHANLMLLNRTDPREIVSFLNTKILSLTRPKKDTVVLWDGDGMTKDSFWGLRRKSDFEGDEGFNPEKEIEEFLERITHKINE